MTNLRSRVKKLEEQSSGNRLVFLPIPENADFWQAAERVIASGQEPGAIDLNAIIKELDGTSKGLPSIDELEEYSDDHFALVKLMPGEIFENAVQRLKYSGQTPDIIGGGHGH